MNTNTINIWTLFHGDQPRKHTCQILSDDKECDALLPTNLLPRTISSKPFKDSDIIINIHHQKLLEHYNFLALTGLIPPGGANKRVLDLRFQTERSRPFVNKTLIATRIPQSNAKQHIEGDFESTAFTLMRQEVENSSVLEQQMYFQVLAIPKGDVRVCVLTFRNRSLEPCYHMIRSLPDEIIFETASSY